MVFHKKQFLGFRRLALHVERTYRTNLRDNLIRHLQASHVDDLHNLNPPKLPAAEARPPEASPDRRTSIEGKDAEGKLVEVGWYKCHSCGHIARCSLGTMYSHAREHLDYMYARCLHCPNYKSLSAESMKTHMAQKHPELADQKYLVLKDADKEPKLRELVEAMSSLQALREISTSKQPQTTTMKHPKATCRCPFCGDIVEIKGLRSYLMKDVEYFPYSSHCSFSSNKKSSVISHCVQSHTGQDQSVVTMKKRIPTTAAHISTLRKEQLYLQYMMDMEVLKWHSIWPCIFQNQTTAKGAFKEHLSLC